MEALNRGENGAKVSVDKTGDGNYEHTFNTDSELTGDDFIRETQPSPEPEPDPSPAPRPRPEPEHDPGMPLPPFGFRADYIEDRIPYVNLSWEHSETDNVVQYNLYTSTGGVALIEALTGDETAGLQFWLLDELHPDRLEYTDTGLSLGIKYYYVITSVDEHGNESDITSEVVWIDTGTGEVGTFDPIDWGPHRIIDVAAEDDSSGCFIATAAYGTDMMHEVLILKDFRNRFLIASSAGRMLTEAYYQISPILAKSVEGNSLLSFVGRTHLAPFVKVANIVLGMN